MSQRCKWKSAVILLHQFCTWWIWWKYFCFLKVFFFVKMPISCRFYKHKYPEIDDVVMVNVRSIAEMGAYVNLLEYNNIEGMILLSELSRRRIRSINKLIRVGRHECVVVIRVDKDKGLLVFSFCKFHNQKQILHFFTLLLAVHAHWGRPPEIYKLY